MEPTKLNRIKDILSGFFIPVWHVIRAVLRKYTEIIIFLVIPLIFLLNVTVVHYSLGTFFLGSIDPEYFYLYNGIILGAGNLSIQYFAHPGTPLHFLIAISSRIVDLFQPGDYMKSFVDDPEKYLHAANLFMNVLIALVLFICGIFTKKYSGSYFAGLLLQLSPFGSAVLWGISGRLIPEAVMMIPLLLTGLMIVKHIFNESETSGPLNDLVLFAVIIGFGIACKLSFIPVILLPLILYKTSFKLKSRFFFYTILFFAIFAYPVVFNFGQFWSWVSGMFTHSGKWGNGEQNFIDLVSVPGNVKYLFQSNSQLFYVAIFSVLLALLFSFKYIKQRSLPVDKITRAIFAVNFTILVCVAFTLKHFALHYFMPFTIFKYLLVLLCSLLILRFQKISDKKIYKTIAITAISLIILFITYGQVLQVRSAVRYSEQKNLILQQEYTRINALIKNDRPMIISGPYYGTPFIAFAHFNGFSMSNHLKGFYTDYLKEKFPQTYHYVTWSDDFDFWDDFVDFNHILNRTESSFYIYIGKERGADLAEIENRMWQFLDKDSTTTKVLYHDVKTDEQLLEIVLN